MNNKWRKIASILFCVSCFIVVLSAEHFDCKDISLKIKNASDPNAVFQNAKSYLIKQKIIIHGAKKAEFQAEIKFKEPDLVRFSYFYKDKLVSAIIIKGEKAWKISGVDNTASEISGAELERIKLFHQISSPKSTLCSIFEDMKIEKVKIKDEELYQIFCRPKSENLPQITFFISSGNYLQRRMLTTNEKGEPYSAEILNYSLIENVFIPSETKVMSGGIQQNIIMESLLLNIEIPDSEFEIPNTNTLNNNSEIKSK